MKSLTEFVTDIYEELDYKRIYKKFHSSPEAKAKRAALNKHNRDHDTYGNHDGKDASHKGGKITGYESEHANRSRSEASRKPGSKRDTAHWGESSDFRGANGVQPDGHIDPEADKAAKAHWKKKRKTLKEFAEDMKPLYVRRDVLNADQIIEWAKSIGFDKCVPPEEMHITIVYSREAVDRSRISPHTDQLRFDSGYRSVEPLGDEGAVVLKFEAPWLNNRWQQFRDLGASWDYEGYMPHLTLTYHNPPDIMDHWILPYDGPIYLGPEEFEDLDLDFKDGVVEEGYILVKEIL